MPPYILPEWLSGVMLPSHLPVFLWTLVPCQSSHGDIVCWGGVLTLGTEDTKVNVETLHYTLHCIHCLHYRTLYTKPPIPMLGPAYPNLSIVRCSWLCFQLWLIVMLMESKWRVMIITEPWRRHQRCSCFPHFAAAFHNICQVQVKNIFQNQVKIFF